MKKFSSGKKVLPPFVQEISKILDAVNRLSKCPTFDALCKETVLATRELFDFDRVGMWFFLPDGKTMQGSFGTDEKGNLTDERSARLPIEARHLNTLVQSKKPVVLFENEPLRICDGTVVGYGPHVVAGLWNGEKMIGLLGADNLIRKHPISPLTVELLNVYAVSVAHLCTLKKTEETLWAFSTRLTEVLNVMNLLSRCEDQDLLYRKAIEMGLQHLGFDRLGLWFLSEDQTIMYGCYGTDETGQIRDEKHLQKPISHPQAKAVAELLHSNAFVLFFKEYPLFNDKGEEIGRGEHAVAKIVSGEKTIGILGADNWIRKNPITEEDVKILQLYGQALGSIFTENQVKTALRQSEAHYRALSQQLTKIMEAVNLLSKCETFDDLCREAVLTAKKLFDFDRVSLWFFLPDGHTMEGSFGTDEKGNLRDERRIRAPTNVEVIRKMLPPENPMLLKENADLLDHQGKVVGKGPHFYGGLWNGEEIIGFLGADNLIRKHPISETTARLATMYAVALGYLCTSKKIQDALRESEQKFRALFEQAAVGVGQLDLQTHRFISVNQKFSSILGYSEPELQALTLESLTHPEDSQEDLHALQKLVQGEIEECTRDKRMIHKNGSAIWVNQTLSAISSEFGKPRYGIVIIQDIALRKRMEEQIQADIREKDVLLKEIHHRVKNNMQVIVSLLNLQAQEIKDPTLVSYLNASKNRIYSMALVHEMLYSSEELSTIPLHQYIETLVYTLFQSFGIPPSQIQLEFDLEPVLLEIEQAVPCGLIVQELVTNALKHAFPSPWEKEAKIRIRLYKKNGTIGFSVADTGKGLPPPKEMPTRGSGSLGFRLIHLLGEEQLDGKVTVIQENGTEVIVEFPEKNKRNQSKGGL